MNDYEPLKGYEKLYTINKEGSVWNIKHKKEVKPYINNGYCKVNLSKDDKQVIIRFHRLLAVQFIPNPDNLPEIDHINGIKVDNRLENLRWVNHIQNSNNRKSNSLTRYIYTTSQNRYQVRFRVNGKKIHFGNYKTLEEAMCERDCALDEHGILNYCYGLEPVNDYLKG